jgi:hypothetical protein
MKSPPKEMSNTWQSQSCKVRVSTPFIFESPAVQRANNMVYEYVQAYNTANNVGNSGNVYKFKSDYERMQYLLGQKGRATGCNKQYGY